MAYNKTYNPDALPAHVEPEQAAAMLSHNSRQNSNQGYGRPQSNSPASQPPSYNKPPPPLPPTSQPHGAGGIGRGRGAGYGSYGNDRYGADPYASGDRYGGDPYGRGGGKNYNTAPPPPVPSRDNYGMGSPPVPPQGPFQQNAFHRPSQAAARPPPTPSPGIVAGADPGLIQLFQSVDLDGSGQLTERELRAALVNSDHSSFDPHTVRMMIRMFDSNNSGSIGFQEFSGLWGFLSAWRDLFDRFDEDRSGYISYDEYSKALVAFGYRLTPPFVTLLYRTYDKRGDNAMSFDLFVQSCISLKRMTDVFKKYDDDRDGYITLSFEEFLTEILRQR